MGRFVEVCRKGVKVNIGKSKVVMLGGEEVMEEDEKSEVICDCY